MAEVIIYLHFCLFPSFISLERVPLPKFGLLARGVYRVPPLAFPLMLRHCGTFQEYSGIVTSNLSTFFLPLLYISIKALAYCFAKHEHYKHLSLCEHGLSSASMKETAITRNLQMSIDASLLLRWFHPILNRIHVSPSWKGVSEYQNSLHRCRLMIHSIGSA